MHATQAIMGDMTTSATPAPCDHQRRETLLTFAANRRTRTNLRTAAREALVNLKAEQATCSTCSEETR